MQKFWNNPHRQQHTRINEQIRISPVRVIKNGQQLGVMSITSALQHAKDENLDLVEIAPLERPPVCHIMDYGKFRFEESRRKKENLKKQRVVQDKEIRLSPVVDKHDLETKVNHAKEFIADGKRVQFTLKFKGRLIVHKDLGFEVMSKALDMLQDIAMVDMPPRMEGKTIICRVIPKKEAK